MYQVILCDDDNNFISYIKKMLEKAGLAEENAVFQEYNSGKELLDNITQDTQCDLLILDIQMPGLDGNETAKEFRKLFPNTVLVFCSGECLPTVKSFKVTPFRYLLKEYKDEEIISELKEVLEEVKKRAGYVQAIEGHYRNGCIKIKVCNIVYIEKWKRGSKIHVHKDCAEALFGESILSSYKLDELYELLQDAGFGYAHNSYIVNFNHINKILSNELYIQDKEILTISRTYMNDFKLRYTKWLAAKY